MFQGLLPIGRREAIRDSIAGVTLAALAIPEVMGYTRIAGTPVVTGLYTLLLPAALFALFGSSRLLVVGADSATAAIMAASLAPLLKPASDEWMAAAGMLALLTAAILLVARVARLAFLADFLSRTVLIGFLAGVGVQVALGELPGVLGLHADAAHGTILKAWYTLQHLGEMHGADAAVGIGVVALTGLLRVWSRKLPGALIAVIAALIASWALGLQTQGVAVLGPLQGGLPRLALPWGASDFAQWTALLPTALAMSVVILAQSAATSRAYAWKYDKPFSEEADLLGLALANAGAGLTGTFVVNGSPTKTEMVDAAGGRSQVAHLTMAAVVLIVLLFFTGPIALLPTAALSGVVFLIGVELIRVRELRRILAVRPSEFWVAAVTGATVVLAGVEQAVAVAMSLSLIDHVRRGYRPLNSVIARGEDGHAKLLPVSASEEYAPGLMIYRFSHSMYYANAELLSREVIALTSAAKPPLRWFVLDLDSVDDVDFSAGATLASLRKTLAERGIELKFLRASKPVVESLRAYGLLTGAANGGETFTSIRDMRHHFEGNHPSAESTKAGALATPDRQTD
jgi:MFS superfamily sulfate permease-like transporter